MSKSTLLLDSLRIFFDDPTNAKMLIDILDHKKGVSLRTLESFITVKSKNENITYTTKTGKNFVVHVAYKSSLVGY